MIQNIFYLIAIRYIASLKETNFSPFNWPKKRLDLLNIQHYFIVLLPLRLTFFINNISTCNITILHVCFLKNLCIVTNKTSIDFNAYKKVLDHMLSVLLISFNLLVANNHVVHNNGISNLYVLTNNTMCSHTRLLDGGSFINFGVFTNDRVISYLCSGSNFCTGRHTSDRSTLLCCLYKYTCKWLAKGGLK